MNVTETIMSNKKMNDRTSRRVDAKPGKQLFEFRKLIDNRALKGEAYSSKINLTYKCSIYPSGDRKETVSSFSMQKYSAQSSNKRRAPEIMGNEKKRQKMDRCATQQCSVLLKTLMTHPAGWVFNHPVDPVALNIPDYFSIISEPMDLGTIKSKLQENMYPGTDRFAADVRLTFANAMLYNPPSNSVHKMANEVSDVFERRWKLLEGKWFETSKLGQGNLSSEEVKDNDDRRDESRNKLCPSIKTSLLSNSTSSEKKVIRLSLKPNGAEGYGLNKSTLRNFSEDAGSKLGCNILNGKRPRILVSPECGTCNRILCQCSFSSDLTNVSSDLSSERPLIRDPFGSVNSCKLTSEVKLSNSQIPKSDSDSDSEGSRTPVFEIQLSPKKALRASMLKSRFAETILKAQQKTLLANGDKVDPVKMKQEKEKMERRQREERERIEAQIKAAEAATRMRAKVEQKQQREKEREAARVAIKMMEKTVQLDQNLEFLRELERLSGTTIPIQNRSNSRSSPEAAAPQTPLERLGLYLKDEFPEDEDEEMVC